MDSQQYSDAFGMASRFASACDKNIKSANTMSHRFGSFSEAFIYALGIVGLEVKPVGWRDPSGKGLDAIMPHPPPGDVWLWDHEAVLGPILKELKS